MRKLLGLQLQVQDSVWCIEHPFGGVSKFWGTPWNAPYLRCNWASEGLGWDFRNLKKWLASWWGFAPQDLADRQLEDLKIAALWGALKTMYGDLMTWQVLVNNIIFGGITSRCWQLSWCHFPPCFMSTSNAMQPLRLYRRVVHLGTRRYSNKSPDHCDVLQTCSAWIVDVSALW